MNLEPIDVHATLTNRYLHMLSHVARLPLTVNDDESDDDDYYYLSH